MSTVSVAQVSFQFIALATMATIINLSGFCNGDYNSQLGCIQSEREALLTFKQHLQDPSNRLASWNDDDDESGDCCKWAGVACNNFTGHVLQLDLANPFSGIESEAYKRSKLVIIGKITNPSLVDLKHLIHLDLSGNDFGGIRIPENLCSLRNLRYLNLSGASFAGMIPHQLGNLYNLQHLDLSMNKLNGTISEIHLSNLTKLVSFSASGNSLVFQVNPSWVPPFQLQRLRLRLCHLGPQFPQWLQSQNHLHFLDISNTNISGSVPTWFWDSASQYQYLNLSRNQIQGQIPNFDSPSNNQTPSSLGVLDLSYNNFSGSIFNLICNRKNNLQSLFFLKLSKNNLSGELPDCWMNLPNLNVLNLCHNHFTGNLPISIGALRSLLSLNLRNTRLGGTIPLSLRNCSSLISLNLAENEFVGEVPKWMGVSFPGLSILNLRSNKFRGDLPNELCALSALHIVEVAYNNISGAIPRCISNFTAMAARSSPSNQDKAAIMYFIVAGEVIVEGASVVMKGFMSEYSSILNLIRSIDLSKNNFSGEIPLEVSDLGGLQSLNLSHNFFTGKIPENIGNMRSIESLDFSRNLLSGKVPQSISRLSFLNHLNISDNGLTGEIPRSTQLQSLNASCFAGNHLCGAPLPICNEKNGLETTEERNGIGNEDDDDDDDWAFYASMAIGFMLGFWCFIGTLITKRRKNCRFLDDTVDSICCFVRKYY